MEKNYVAVKLVVIAGMILLLLIPISMVKSLVSERMDTKNEVVKEISSKWGGEQSLIAPILVVPYKKGVQAGKTIIENTYFLSETFSLNGNIVPEKRSRNIFEVLVYESDLKMNGRFSFPDYEKLNIDENNILWEDAYIFVGISDMVGVRNKVSFQWNNHTIDSSKRFYSKDLESSGLQIPVNLNELEKVYSYDFHLMLNGTNDLNIYPIGKQNEIDLRSSWNTVAFTGEFLPSERNVEDDGLKAIWNIFDYNLTTANYWKGNYDINKTSKLGVSLRLPVDNYQKTTRITKYAIMFIVLTFTLFFLLEVLSHKRIHPVQYLLVSFALILFYSLLLSLSEHLSFGWSYLISALATLGLVIGYVYTILRNWKQLLIVGFFFGGLYTYLYVVLLLEDMALLMGTLGLFAMLGIAMFASRKVDWYRINMRIVEE